MNIEPERELHTRVLRMVLAQERSYPSHLSTARYLSALRGVVEEHAPALAEAKAVKALDCPLHSAQILQKPEEVDPRELEACPHCPVAPYVYCSSWECTSRGYPCQTVKIVASALGVSLLG